MAASSVFLLKSNSITMFSPEIGEGKSATFSEQALKHLEIKDSEKFKDELEDFLSDLKPQEVVLMLSEEVTFQKNIPLSDNYESEKEEFFDKIPFSKKNVARKELKTEKEIYFFSANQEIYKTIIEVCTHKGWIIDKVVPAAIFPSIAEKTALTAEETAEILHSDEVLEKANLIDGEEYIVEEETQSQQEEEKEKEKEKEEDVLDQQKQSRFSVMHLIFGLIVLLILGGIVLGAYQFRERFKSRNQTEAQKIIEQAIEDIPISSPSASPDVLDKEDLKIEVLNGSGVAGQAARIKTRLENLGFENISTGNSPYDNRAEAVASYSASVSNDIREEISDDLKLNFADLIESEATSGSEFDITIITGTRRAN